MSAAAGALALASVATPPATGAPPGAPPDAAASPFDGLLAGEGKPVATGSESQPGPDAAPVDVPPKATTAIDPAAQPATAPAAPPPPMDDPATSAVLNALALRMATEARAAGTPAPLPGVVTDAATSMDGSVPDAGATNAAVAPAAAAVSAGAAALAGAVVAATPQFAAAIAAAMPGFSTRMGAAANGAGAPLVPMADPASPPEPGDAGALDALLSTLDALLPSGPARPSAAGTGAVPLAAGPPPITLPTALPPAAPLPSAPAAGAEAASALLDAVAGDIGGEAGSPAAAPSAPGPGTGAATPFASLLATATANGGAPAGARADGGQPPIPVPFDSPKWGDEFATRVVGFAREQFSEAEIRVTPDELGPIEVKLRFDGDRVHAQFGAISPEAREALTANLHRLREMLAGEGLNLGQAFVGHHGQDAARRFDGSAARSGPEGGDDEDAPLAEVRATTTLRRGLLDEFA